MLLSVQRLRFSFLCFIFSTSGHWFLLCFPQLNLVDFRLCRCNFHHVLTYEICQSTHTLEGAILGGKILSWQNKT